MKRFTLLSMLVALFSVAAFAQKGMDLRLLKEVIQTPSLTVNGIDRKAQARNNVARRAGELVTPPATATVETWYTTGGMFYVGTSTGWVEYTSEMSSVKVAVDGFDIYIQGLAYWFPEAWVKGMVMGSSVTFNNGQLLGEDDYGAEYLVGSDDGSTVSGNILFNYDAEQGILQAATPYIIESGAASEVQPYTFWYMPSFSKAAPEKPEPVVAPADLVAEEWSMSYKNSDDEASTDMLKIGFAGNDVYLQGLCSYLPEAWIKGTLDGSTITFPGWQYFGAYKYNNKNYEMFLQEENVVLNYDAEAGKMTAVNDSITTCLSAKQVLDNYKNVVITKVLEKAATPATPTISQIYDSTDGPVVMFTVPAVDVDGNGILTSKLSFQFFKDIEEEISAVTFDPADYKYLTEAMTIIPYGFTDDYDFYTNGIYLNQQDFSQWNKIGIQSIYTGGGEEHKSEIFWLTIKEYQKTIFDFNAMTDEPCSSNDSNAGDITADRQFTVNGVTLTVSPNPATDKTPNRFWSTKNGPQLRVYGGTLTFEAPVGKVLTKIVFNNGKWNDNNSADTGAFEGNVWTGNAQKVVVTIAGNTQLNNIVVYPGDDVPTVVEVPEGLAIEAYVFKATAVEAKQDPADEVAEPYNNIVQIGFDGNDAYIQGLNGDDPDQWVKATKNEAGQYVIPANQYMGTIDLFGMYYFDYFFTAVDAEGNMVDAVFDFDAEKSLFTTAQTLVLNGAASELYPYITFTDVTIEKFVELAATPADPIIEAVNFADTSYPNIYCSIPTVGTNGEVLNPGKLFYTVWIEKNGEPTPYTFTAAAYNQDFTEDVTEVPYAHDGYDIYSGGEIIYFEETFEELASWTKVGIQTIYKGAGEEHKSNIAWLDNATAISAVKADNGKAVIFNMAGQRLSAPQKGLNIINGRKVMIK